MKKKILFLSILCLLFVTLSYTYSSFKNTIVANITANVKNWVFKVSVNNGTIKDGGYNLHLSGTSGSFNVNINTTGSKSGADYTIELISDSSIKFYTDSSYTKLINNNTYSGSINSNTSSSVTIYYKSDTAINSDILIKTKGIIMEMAPMKNDDRNYYRNSNDYYYHDSTEFWNSNYKNYIRSINFSNELNNLPSSCSKENLCWNISENKNQKKKVYGYLIDTGLKDSTDNTKPLYNLYIVSEAVIAAPQNCGYIFEGFKNLVEINFNENFNTSNTTNMDSMFRNCKFLTGLDLSNFNTENATNMSYMFYYCKSVTNLDLSNFNTSNITNMGYMFSGCSSLTNLDLSNFNTANVIDMSGMFHSCSSLTNLDLSNFNTANVTSMIEMFYYCSSLTSLDLSSFNTANVTTMDSMFWYCETVTSLDLSSFNTSNVTGMSSMFSLCSSLTSLDLSSFNTIKVTNMNQMFNDCSSLTSLNLSNFNTVNVSDMSYMFQGCSSLTSLDLSSFNTSNVTSMLNMFEKCTALTTTINITNANISSYQFNYMFLEAATKSGSQITVNYISSLSTLVDNMIKTKSTNSNVIKGSIIAEHSITIIGNDDIKYESYNRAKGTKVALISLSGNNYVTSFKMNGTTINGNEFIMPDTDVTISDIATTPSKIIESAHDPYPNSQDNVIIGEHTFEGAKSLTVILDYQTESTNYDYFLIYDSSSSTTGINDNKKYGGKTRTKETITINSNYIKITFKSDGGGNNYYGLRAIIIPNY